MTNDQNNLPVNRTGVGLIVLSILTFVLAFMTGYFVHHWLTPMQPKDQSAATDFTTSSSKTEASNMLPCRMIERGIKQHSMEMRGMTGGVRFPFKPFSRKGAEQRSQPIEPVKGIGVAGC